MKKFENDSIGNRMKTYEAAFDTTLPKRLPLIIRVDGRAFHSWTKGCKRPFDMNLVNAMNRVALALCDEIDGAVFGFVQSDEISVLVHNYKTHDTMPWLKNRLQKITSIAAACASASMTHHSEDIFGKTKLAMFDARVIILPESDVCNYFLWRQQDATRNSIQMVAQSMYSHKQLYKKNQKELQEMIFQKGQNWNDLSIALKRGRGVIRVPRTISVNGQECVRYSWGIDEQVPIFSQNRAYIEDLLTTSE